MTKILDEWSWSKGREFERKELIDKLQNLIKENKNNSFSDVINKYVEELKNKREE